MGPHTVGRRFCAVQVFSPQAKTLAQAEFISAEHLNQKDGGGLWPPEPKKKDSLAAVLLFGDPSGIRTPDPLLKRQLLCRLS